MHKAKRLPFLMRYRVSVSCIGVSLFREVHSIYVRSYTHSGEVYTCNGVVLYRPPQHYDYLSHFYDFCATSD